MHMLTETKNNNIGGVADEILRKCTYSSHGLYVGVTDAVTGIVKFKFAEDNENPAYIAQHIRSYANDTCLQLFKHLLSRGVSNYGIQYLGEENPANLRTLFVVHRSKHK